MTQPTQARCVWTEGLQLTTTVGTHSVVMDAKKPLGKESAATPKELLLAAICGCTAMDVVALMKKHHQTLESLSIEASAETRDAHPTIFTSIHLHYRLKGTIDLQKAKEAVRLSETLYCSVSAMVSSVVPIDYEIEVNGTVVDRGKADFPDLQQTRQSGAA